MAVVGGQFLLEKTGSREIFTPEQYSKDELEFAATARRFVEREVIPHIKALENKDYVLGKKLLQKAGELGLLMTGVPEAYGGLGLPHRVSGMLSEAVSGYGGFSVSFGAHTKIGTLPLVYFGNAEQKQKWLPALASGEKIAAYALSEPGSGSDAQAATTVAKLSDDGTHYVVNGTKQWITNGSFADVYTVFCQVDDGSGKPQFSALMVERGTPGFEAGAEEHKLGIRGSSTTPLTFVDAKIPVANLLGNPGDGAAIAFNILNVGRYTLAMGVNGGAKAALAAAIQYATERKQFGKSTMSFGALRQKVAETAAQIYAMETCSYRIAGLSDDMTAAMGPLDESKSGKEKMRPIEEYAIESSIAKVYCSETLNVLASECLQMYGGYGYVEDYPAERTFRDSRINMIFEGTNEVNRLLVPGMLLKRAMQGRLGAMQWLGSLESGPQPVAEGPLADERDAVDRMKGVAGVLLQAAVGKYMHSLEKEQQILLYLADLLIDAYVGDSVVGRALYRQKAGLPSAVSDAMTRLTLSHAADRVRANARACARSLASGEDLEKLLKKVDRWAIDLRSNPIADRDLIADAAVEKGGYPF
ncbi:MAG: acyl-CoA dehydrogenase family protein [Myxococcales bacterium]|nr:acyl-CoA dehydrogenase family protein [Myxococcales bacterium]